MNRDLNFRKVTRRGFIRKAAGAGLVITGGGILAACGDPTATTAPVATTAANTTASANTSLPASITTGAASTTARTTNATNTTTSATAGNFADLGPATDFATVAQTPKAVSLDPVKQNSGGGFISQVDGKYFAISNVCTHQGCEVDYIPSSKTYICPCHGSTYNANGGVIQGPATLPLARYEAKIEGGRLLVSLKPSN